MMPHALQCVDHHPQCCVCSQNQDSGMGFRVHYLESGSVAGTFDCDHRYQGFPGILHGGVIAMLLDEAMTQCLFYHGVVGLTGRLNVSFVEKVLLGKPVRIQASIIERCDALYVLKAEMRQGSSIKARARGKFASTKT